MKSILLTSTALVAFAGAAAADGHTSIDFSGSAVLGYNADPEDAPTQVGDHDGFYSDINLEVSMSATLDNGITVTASADVDELDAADAAAGGVTLKIASSTASLTYGDVEFAAVDKWSSVGSMDADGFLEQDGEIVLRGDATFGDVSAAFSTTVDAADLSEAGDMSVGLAATFGSVSVTAAYQEPGETFGISGTTTVAGFDLGLGYAENDSGAASTGISLGYTVGPVALAASYVMEEVGEDNWDVSATYDEGALYAKIYTDESDDYGVNFEYDMSNGLTVYAGIGDGGDDTYAGVNYDLGGDANLLVAYAEDGDGGADDEIGPNDWQAGTTVSVTFSF